MKYAKIALVTSVLLVALSLFMIIYATITEYVPTFWDYILSSFSRLLMAIGILVISISIYNKEKHKSEDDDVLS